MIMAHATTILPAVLHITLPYRRAFWAPIVLLQVSLVVRLWIGDALGLPVGWQIGGVLGVAALLLFVITAVTSAILGPPRAAAPSRRIHRDSPNQHVMATGFAESMGTRRTPAGAEAPQGDG
jgi:hypothetical protein